jgi:hypothetical protein
VHLFFTLKKAKQKPQFVPQGAIKILRLPFFITDSFLPAIDVLQSDFQEGRLVLFSGKYLPPGGMEWKNAWKAGFRYRFSRFL